MSGQTSVLLWKAETEQIYNPFRYVGEYYDSETGLIYLRNRYYDNSIGRFITEDPIRDGTNWYVYCNSNPVMFVDPFGLKDVPLREFVESHGGKVYWNSNIQAATVDFESAGIKTYYVGEYKTRSDDSYSSQNPYLKYVTEESGTTLRMYINDQDIIGDFGIKDSEMKYVSDVDATFIFTLFKKGNKYYQRMTINGDERIYEKVNYKNFKFYVYGEVRRYKISYSKVNEGDCYEVNKSWKNNLKTAVDFLGADPAMGTKCNFIFSLVGLYTGTLQSDSILDYVDYAIRFRNRNYYFRKNTIDMVAYTEYTR